MTTESVTNDLASQLKNSDARRLTQLFHESLFLGLTQNTHLDDKAKSAYLANTAAMIRGFEKGSLDAIDEMYSRIFDIAYNLGYKEGSEMDMTMEHLMGEPLRGNERTPSSMASDGGSQRRRCGPGCHGLELGLK